MNRATVVFPIAIAAGFVLAATSRTGPLDAAGGLAWTDEPEDGPFATSDRCIACHRGVSTPDGTDTSIGHDWRASMMANSARDPYWQAAVRREVMDHPEASAAIQAQCARCHMPMASPNPGSDSQVGLVFANLPISEAAEGEAALAADGVSCTVCHRISPEGLETEDSYSGGFRIDESPGRPVFGPFEPDAGGAGIMHSATGFRPEEAAHVQSSGLCASCHTLFTHALRPDGTQGPEFPEQVPYLEWQASAYRENRTCQDCHMPEAGADVPVTLVLGRPRPAVSRHVFRGGNFFMLRMLNRYREELGVAALPAELELAAERTEEHLRNATATVEVSSAAIRDGRVFVEAEVRNLAGHKFPTGYPSRRAWLHVAVTDGADRPVFESGAFLPSGRVVGDDHDEDGSRYERHYEEIRSPDQVQVYQAVMTDGLGVTTGLTSAEQWVKDNRILPVGFDAAAAGSRAAVQGSALLDDDFRPGSDRIRYSVAVDPDAGPFTVEIELLFQPIAYRWAENLAAYDAVETRRFVGYYREMAAGSALVLAEAVTVVN